MDIDVSPGMARRRGATKEHVRRGPVTEEQRRRRAIIGETLRAEVFLPRGFVARRVQVATPRSAPQAKNSLSSDVQSFSTDSWTETYENIRYYIADYLLRSHRRLHYLFGSAEKVGDSKTRHRRVSHRARRTESLRDRLRSPDRATTNGRANNQCRCGNNCFSPGCSRSQRLR